MTEIVLASQSPYRRIALEQLGLSFECDAPHIDETPEPGEPIADLVKRLSISKVKTVAQRHPKALIIGGDQCASVDGQILGKPGNYENAVKQLSLCSGRVAEFHSGMCLYRASDEHLLFSDGVTRVVFRALSESDIAAYVKKDEPYDCAGSIRCECLGVSLLERIENDDPTSLMGLPLIMLTRLLRESGVDVLDAP